LKNLFLFNKKIDNNKVLNHVVVDPYIEIGKIVREARIQQNISIQKLSLISKIPEKTINSIENNNKNIRPKYPFLRSILIKLEECLGLKKNTLVKLETKQKEHFKIERKDFLFSKFDLTNTWQGNLIYFFILVLSIFILKRYFIINVNFIEIQNTEKKIIEK